MTDKTENESSLTVEQRVLIVMRQVLASVVREVTPQPGMRHPLSEQTIGDIKNCFSLIAARERELQSQQGQKPSSRPVYPGQRSNVQVVEFDNVNSDDSNATDKK